MTWVLGQGRGTMLKLDALIDRFKTTAEGASHYRCMEHGPLTGTCDCRQRLPSLARVPRPPVLLAPANQAAHATLLTVRIS